MKHFRPNKASITGLVNTLESLMYEAETWDSTKPDYAKRMKELVHNMALLTLLEFTGKNNNPKLDVSQMKQVLQLMEVNHP